LLVLGSNDSQVENLLNQLGDEELSSLMANRPTSSLMYRKENSGLVFENTEQTEQIPNRNEIISQLTDKKNYTQDTTNDKVFIHNERLATSKKNNEEKKKFQKEIKGARTIATHYDAEVFLISDADGEKLFISKDSPDGVINGYFLELKTTTSDNINTIRNRIRKASKQGEILYLNLSENPVSMDTINNAISLQYTDSKKTMEGMGVIIAKNDEIVSDGIIKNGVLEEGLHFNGLRKIPQSNYKIRQDQQKVNQTQTYNKNIDFLRDSETSVLVPYTTEQMVGRIRVGKPVDTSDIQTLLETDNNMTSYQRSVLTKEIEAIRTLTANPILYNTILDKYSQTKDYNLTYDEVMKAMKELDSNFKFETKQAGLALIKRAIAHSTWNTTESLNINFISSIKTNADLESLALDLKRKGYLDKELVNRPA